MKNHRCIDHKYDKRISTLLKYFHNLNTYQLFIKYNCSLLFRMKFMARRNY